MSTTRVDPAIGRPQLDNRAPDLESYTGTVVDGLHTHALARALKGRPSVSLSRSSDSVWGSATVLLGALMLFSGLGAIVAIEGGGLWTWIGRVVATLSAFGGIAVAVLAAAVDRVVPPARRPDSQLPHLPLQPDAKHPMVPHWANTGLVEYVPGELWVAQQPLVFYGMQLGARMTVVKANAAGDLLVYSPIALNDRLKAQVEALGNVKFLVAPNILHHLFVGEWLRAFPGAQAWAAPGLAKRRPDVAWTGTLESDRTDVPWDRDCADFLVTQGHPLDNEVLLFAPNAKTLVVADAIQNLGHEPEVESGRTRLFLELFGMRGRPTPPTDHKLTLEDPAALGRVANRVLDWDFERIVLAHGRLVERDARDVWADAYAFCRGEG